MRRVEKSWVPLSAIWGKHSRLTSLFSDHFPIIVRFVSKLEVSHLGLFRFKGISLKVDFWYLWNRRDIWNRRDLQKGRDIRNGRDIWNRADIRNWIGCPQISAKVWKLTSEVDFWPFSGTGKFSPSCDSVAPTMRDHQWWQRHPCQLCIKGKWKLLSQCNFWRVLFALAREKLREESWWRSSTRRRKKTFG